MRFGPVPLDDAQGAILAHSLTAGGKRLKKGHVVAADDVARLRAAGLAEVIVARPGPGDIGEDAAAAALAAPLAGPGLRVDAPFTGRANLFADAAGLFDVEAEVVHAVNAVDPALTLATLPPMTRVAAGDMVATVKIMPYALPEATVSRAVAAARPALRVHPWQRETASLILTRTPGMKDSLLAKGQDVVARRLSARGVRLTRVEVVDHTTAAVARALTAGAGRFQLILSASATSDPADVCPAGLIAAGGRLTRVGMPVDPGNLLFLGDLAGAPVLGLPGCARSPALNGADWVLERLIAGLTVTSDDIAAMGVGGLLMEIPTRPQPRAFDTRTDGPPRVEVILLAAGASRRMGGRDKLMEPVGGVPVLRRAALAMLESRADAVHVVLPPDRPARADALAGLDVAQVTATDAAEGMAASLRAGLRAVSPAAQAVVVALADMPEVGGTHVDALIAAFDPEARREICRAVTASGRRGHPVLFGRRFFESLAGLTGDEGARAVIAAAGEHAVDVPTDGEAATLDLDTPEAWAAYRAQAS